MPSIHATPRGHWSAILGVVGLLGGCAVDNPDYIGVGGQKDPRRDAAPQSSDLTADVDAPLPADGSSQDHVPAEVDVPADEAPALQDAADPDVAPADVAPPEVMFDATPNEDGAGDGGVAPDGAAVCTTPVMGTGTGLRGEYFTNRDLTGTPIIHPNENIDWSFGDGSPDPGVGANDFSARWTGLLQPMYTGTYTFIADYDDGMRMFLDGRVVMYRWGPRLSPGRDTAKVILEAGRKYDLGFEFFEMGSAATARLSWEMPCHGRQVIPKRQLYSGAMNPQVCPMERAPSGAGSGLKVEYFASEPTSSQTRPLVTDHHPRLDFDWGTGVPATGVPANFFARWSGMLEAAVDGPLTIYLHSDDVGRLRFEGAPLFDSWSEPFGPQEVAATVDVKAGQRYNIAIDFRDDTGGALVHLLWSWPCQPKTVIPANRLYRP